jgi:hypothetical protein
MGGPRCLRLRRGRRALSDLQHWRPAGDAAGLRRGRRQAALITARAKLWKSSPQLWTATESKAHDPFRWMEGTSMNLERYFFVAAAASLLMLIGGMAWLESMPY